MPYTIESNFGLQAITSSDTVALTDMGRKVVGRDATYGYGEFVHIKATAAITVGQAVLFDAYNSTGVLATTTSRGLVGFAMASIASGSFGWVQVFGNAVVVSTTAVASNIVYASATPGTVLSTVSATNQIDNAIFKTANGTPAAGFAVAQIAYPAMTGKG